MRAEVAALVWYPHVAYHQISEGVGVVEARVAAGRNDFRQVVGWQAEVGDFLKMPIRVFNVHCREQQHGIRAALTHRQQLPRACDEGLGTKPSKMELTKLTRGKI